MTILETKDTQNIVAKIKKADVLDPDEFWWTRLSLQLPTLLLLAFLLWEVSGMVGFYVNMTHSLPGTIYVINKMDHTLEKGKTYSFTFHGEYYPHNITFTKRVVGIPGDVVTEKNREFFINNVSVAKAKDFSRQGLPLEINSFRGVIPEGKFFFTTDHPDSFDSRYQMAGLGEEQDVVGRAYYWF